MQALTAPRREFLFLQGPPGPFFLELSRALDACDVGVHRINLSGGDCYDWRGEATDYRGRMRDWPMFFDRFVRANKITDLVLFGDCRPMHQAALRMAQLRGVHIHVFEEGYIRPDWMTLERDGVNGRQSVLATAVAKCVSSRTGARARIRVGRDGPRFLIQVADNARFSFPPGRRTGRRNDSCQPAFGGSCCGDTAHRDHRPGGRPGQ